MPAVAPYIPTRDAAFSAWLANFSTLITASPASYGLTAADAVSIAAQNSAWSAAYAVVTSPNTKTPAAVATKNTARVNAQRVARVYAQQIAANAGVAVNSKIALGLNPRTSTPSPITAPASNPVLTVQYAGNLSLALRFRDSSASPSVKAKPYGVGHLEIRYAKSATPINDPALLTSSAIATKTPFVLSLDGGYGGAQVYMAARWMTRTGKASPWSPIISMTVPVGT
jgi:hypothetical protein